ncbi:MAG TPA: Lrp/AsnC family transcriptional regulator [Negativicutes bacterium]|nr:Lrp/AsnC family transcriptional regulator [Negativicutes bacterium]
MTDIVDQQIIRRVQGEFPLMPDPYRMLAEEIGISEEALLERLRRMKAMGMLRKMGAVLQHRVAGFHGNALCCWRIPLDKVDEVAARMSACSFISHVYLRQPHEKWPYNLYTVFHSPTREECQERVETMAKDIGMTEYRMMFSRKNWKRSQLALLQETT